MLSSVRLVMLMPTPDRRANSRVVPGPLARAACRTILISPRGLLMAQFQHVGHGAAALAQGGCRPTATAGSTRRSATALWRWHKTAAGPRPRPGAPAGRPRRGGAGTRRLQAHSHGRERRQAGQGAVALARGGCTPTATAGSTGRSATARWRWHQAAAGPRPRPGAPAGRPRCGGAGTRRLQAHGRERRQPGHGAVVLVAAGCSREFWKISLRRT